MLKPNEAEAKQTAGRIASGRAGSNRSTGGRRGGEAGEDVLVMNLPARRGEVSQSADGAKGEQL